MPKKVVVIDGNSLMHRAYHAVPQTMNAPDGTPTNAAFGFIAMLLKLVDLAKPDAVICAFDAGRPAFRMEALEQYKAQRPPMDDDLRVQFPIIEDLLASMAIPVVKATGWEGDDVLGTVAARDEAEGYETLLVTGDKDAYQLASDLTRIVTTKKGIADVAIYGPAEVEERYGVTPAQFPDFLGLMGDSSDNIPGVPGIGAKTAAKLLQRFGSMDGIYDNLGELKGKQLENLRDNKEAAYVSREVATIVRDLDLPLDLDGASFPSFSAESVSEAFDKVQFNAHLARVLKLIGEEASKPRAHLSWEPIMRGKDARELANAAIAAGERVGLSFVDPEQAMLFEPETTLAVACEKGTAVFSGAEAHEVFAEFVRTGSFAALDVKSELHRDGVYPPDTESPAQLEPADLMAMDAFDLGLAGYVLNSSTESYTFDALLGAYGGGALPETEGDTERAAVQAAAARALVEPMTAALEADGTARAYFDIDLPLVGVLAVMERTGAALDARHLAEIGTRAKAELDDLRAQIVELAGEEFNVDSPKQLARILFEVIGLKPRKKKQRGYSTDASVLKELAAEHELPGLVLRYREYAKIVSTYIDALPGLVGGDGRLHTSFNETVTTTGRLSSSSPNLQNIPVRTEFGRRIRECFVPLHDGEVFLSADYSQIELRLLAHLSGDENLVAAFQHGADFHRNTAARVFGVPVEEVSPELRSRAKAVNFGIVYGQQAFGLSQSLDIPFGEAREMIERYFEAYPGVHGYLCEVVERARATGFAETMFGRRRYIPELKSKNAAQRGFGERTAMNHPMQGSAADIIKIAMRRVMERLRADGFEARLVLQVHDELDFSVPEGEAERLAAMVREVMEGAVELKVPLVVDTAWGANWAAAH